METRSSHGLQQFCSALEDKPGLRILDLAGASQSTVSFITGLSHQIYANDFLHQLDESFGVEDAYQTQTHPLKAAQFLDTSLNFPANHFDGALLWDTLEFLAPPLLDRVIQRLVRIVRPGSYLLALFHAEHGTGAVPVFSYKIADARTIAMSPRGTRVPAQQFNNRGLEKLFHEFESVKFFLTRDKLREVIVRR